MFIRGILQYDFCARARRRRFSKQNMQKYSFIPQIQPVVAAPDAVVEQFNELLAEALVMNIDCDALPRRFVLREEKEDFFKMLSAASLSVASISNVSEEDMRLVNAIAGLSTLREISLHAVIDDETRLLALLRGWSDVPNMTMLRSLRLDLPFVTDSIEHEIKRIVMRNANSLTSVAFGFFSSRELVKLAASCRHMSALALHTHTDYALIRDLLDDRGAKRELLDLKLIDCKLDMIAFETLRENIERNTTLTRLVLSGNAGTMHDARQVSHATHARAPTRTHMCAV
jgi:hypothetical protein